MCAKRGGAFSLLVFMHGQSALKMLSIGTRGHIVFCVHHTAHGVERTLHYAYIHANHPDEYFALIVWEWRFDKFFFGLLLLTAVAEFLYLKVYLICRFGVILSYLDFGEISFLSVGSIYPKGKCYDICRIIMSAYRYGCFKSHKQQHSKIVTS